ncbi:Synaptobrevin [Aureococcus anophagefferens]|uniref:Synaptobrevin n=3 Tax=Aureococcus anophagefferens TaxID=44056 RepID=A0ABR1FTV4_AURAN
MSNFAKFRERFSSSSKKKEAPSSETPAASAKFADDAKAAMGRVSERATRASASGAATQLQKSPASASAAAARAAGRGVDTKAPTRLGPHTAVLSERYAALGRRMAARADPPGWDDVGDGSSKPLAAGGGNLRCIKLPVCDLAGTSSYVVAFGCGYPLAKAQSLCERLALLLGPLVDAELASRDATAKKAKGVSPEGAKQLREVLEREIAAANSSARLHEVANQVEEVRAIMEKNVEMILDRGEQLESLDAKSEELSTATGMFRKQARKLKRWHLMNQVKYGLAVGTIVTASVAVPIAILVAA